MVNEKKEMAVAQIKKAREKLEAARVLFTQGFIDDAVSRAYYAIFHAASALLLNEGITVESHGALKTMFGLRLVKTGKVDKKYGRILNEMKDERENGDYDIFSGLEPPDAEKAIRYAEDFLQMATGRLENA